MPDELKLKAVPRKRRKSLKSRIRARASEQVKLASVEARKAAVLEYLCEQLEELMALLRAEGFKASSRPEKPAVVTASQSAPAPPAPIHPCAHCGREGVVMNETKTGWLCQVHGQYELGGAIQDRQGQNLAAEMFGTKPVSPKAAQPKPSGPKMIIHPNAADLRASRQPVDMLKGIQNGTVGVLGDDSDEAGIEP